MTTLDINGTHVSVDDSFLSLSPDEQQSTVDHIAASLAPAPAEPVSVNDVARSAATGVPVIGGLLNKADAATNAGLSYALNPLFDEKDQLTGSIGERYNKSLAMQEGSDAKFAADHPVIDTGAKLAGGVASMAPVVAAAPALFGATGGVASRVGMGALSNAVVGGADSAARGEGPVSGAVIGGALGAAAPIAEAAASPFISAVMARFDPEGYANRQVARAVTDSGRSTADIADRVTQAAAEGQPQFNVADAMGNAGQRMLSTVARDTGPGRDNIVNALESRQGSQGRRVTNALSEGFGSRMTPDQLEANMTAERGAIADDNYGAVRDDAQSVDVSNVLDHITQNVPTEPAAPDTISGRLQRYGRMLSGEDGNLTDFDQVQRVRSELADEVQNARQSGQGNRARMLGQVLTRLDTSLENASTGFRQANADFAGASRNIDAIDNGRNAFLRGRTEDTIPAFNALSPRGQQAFRTGYVDPAIANTQGAAVGANKARPLINDAFQAESQSMAPGADLMNRRIGREQTMFETRAAALGGSKTADNLHDAAAMAINPVTVMHAVHGNWAGAISSMIHGGANILSGNTPAVRARVADILLQNGANLNGPQLNAMVSRTIGQLQFLQQLARSGAGAAATTTNASQANRLYVAPANRRPPIFAPSKGN